MAKKKYQRSVARDACATNIKQQHRGDRNQRLKRGSLFKHHLSIFSRIAKRRQMDGIDVVISGDNSGKAKKKASAMKAWRHISGVPSAISASKKRRGASNMVNDVLTNQNKRNINRCARASSRVITSALSRHKAANETVGMASTQKSRKIAFSHLRIIIEHARRQNQHQSGVYIRRSEQSDKKK